MERTRPDPSTDSAKKKGIVQYCLKSIRICSKKEAEMANPRPEIKAVKTKIKIKKADVRQCRLCLRILPRTEVRETRGNNSVDLSRKIETAVSVRILKSDKLTTVCVNCLRLVDITYNFRMACMKTNIIYAGKLVMLHEGSWLEEDKKELLDDCQELVRRHRAEMDKLFTCTGYEGRSLEHATSEQEEPILEVKEDPVEQPLADEIDDSEPEATDEWSKMFESGPATMGKRVRTDNGSIPRGRYICEMCGLVVDKHNEEYHRNEHFNLTPYQCPNCPMAYHSKQAMHRHKLQLHDGKIFTKECNICHKTIRGKACFNRHVARHSDPTVDSVACEICGKRYRKAYMNDHMNTHTGNMEHECSICGRKFAAKTNFFTHMKKYHANGIKTEFTDCGYDLNVVN
uniref:Putative zinc finger protein gfi-1 n=1 Tax=Culex tarsalis TaxID=7177 RepID=A0A1Q3F0A9_CULTA